MSVHQLVIAIYMIYDTKLMKNLLVTLLLCYFQHYQVRWKTLNNYFLIELNTLVACCLN